MSARISASILEATVIGAQPTRGEISHMVLPLACAASISRSLVSTCIFMRAVSAGGVVIRKRLFLVVFYQKFFGEFLPEIIVSRVN